MCYVCNVYPFFFFDGIVYILKYDNNELQQTNNIVSMAEFRQSAMILLAESYNLRFKSS